MLDVDGFILVGGASRRMGRDKSQLVIGRQRGIDRITAELRPVVGDVFLVGSRREYAGSGLKNIPDVHDRWGALGGIHAALRSCKTDWAMIVACDLPFVTRALIGRLTGFAREDAFDAIVPVQPDERPQPLCALYRRGTCLSESDRLIARGEHTPRALLANVRTRRVEFRELADLTGAANFFFNMNTPDEYEEAKEILARLQDHPG